MKCCFHFLEIYKITFPICIFFEISKNLPGQKIILFKHIIKKRCYLLSGINHVNDTKYSVLNLGHQPVFQLLVYSLQRRLPEDARKNHAPDDNAVVTETIVTEMTLSSHIHLYLGP